MKKYHIIDTSSRDVHSELKEYTFEELKNYFKPNEEFAEHLEKWEEIEDLFDLEEYLRFEADGMRVNYIIEEVMTHELMIEVLEADRCTRSEAERFIKSGTYIYEQGQEEDLISSLNEFKEEGEKLYTIEDVKAGNVTDVSYVHYNGKDFYIVYVN